MNANELKVQKRKQLNKNSNSNNFEDWKIPRWLYAILVIAGVLYLIWLLFIKKSGSQRGDFPFF